MQKSSYGVDWRQKPYMIPQSHHKMDRLSDSHKIYQEKHGNLESEIDSRRKKLSWGKDPERYNPGRCTITFDICNSDDAMQPHSQEMHRQIKTK